MLLNATLLVASALVLLAVGWLIGRLGIGKVADPSSVDEAERLFIERMRDVSLIGSYTEREREAGPSTPERYDISSVEKVGPDLWRFHATLTCCGFNGALPVVVPLRWTGDTPMIMMTDTSLPGLGTFSVRLFFYADCYSGTWQHGVRSGFMSGRIQKRGATAGAGRP